LASYFFRDPVLSIRKKNICISYREGADKKTCPADLEQRVPHICFSIFVQELEINEDQRKLKPYWVLKKMGWG